MQNRVFAGAYKIDITPPIGIDLAGYFNVRKADSILDNLYSKVVILKDSKTEVAIVSCDLCVIPRDMVLKIRNLASRWSGIYKENIMITSTHTHTGPVTTGLLAGDMDSSYIDILTRKIATSIAMAKKNIKEAVVSIGRTAAKELVFNRRYVMKDGSVVTNPGKLNPNIVKPAGPVDPEVLIVLIEDKIGIPIALLINFANHVDTIGGTAISADYPGIIAKILNMYIGDIPVLFFPGAEGDINHIDIKSPDPQIGYNEAERIGKTLAEKILESLNKVTSIDPNLKVKSCKLKIPIRKPTPDDVNNARLILESRETDSSYKDLTAFELAKGNIEIERVYAREVIILSEQDKDVEELELQGISLGDLVFLGIPGEPFVEIGLAIKKKSPFNYTAIMALTNGYSGYIPTEKAFDEGGYEIRLARSSKLDRRADKEIIRVGLELLRNLKE